MPERAHQPRIPRTELDFVQSQFNDLFLVIANVAIDGTLSKQAPPTEPLHTFQKLLYICRLAHYRLRFCNSLLRTTKGTWEQWK
jgi:hypothetical protein